MAPKAFIGNRKAHIKRKLNTPYSTSERPWEDGTRDTANTCQGASRCKERHMDK